MSGGMFRPKSKNTDKDKSNKEKYNTKEKSNKNKTSSTQPSRAKSTPARTHRRRGSTDGGSANPRTARRTTRNQEGSHQSSSNKQENGFSLHSINQAIQKAEAEGRDLERKNIRQIHKLLHGASDSEEEVDFEDEAEYAELTAEIRNHRTLSTILIDEDFPLSNAQQQQGVTEKTTETIKNLWRQMETEGRDLDKIENKKLQQRTRALREGVRLDFDLENL